MYIPPFRRSVGWGYMRLKHDARTDPEDAGGPRGLVMVRE